MNKNIQRIILSEKWKLNGFIEYIRVRTYYVTGNNDFDICKLGMSRVNSSTTPPTKSAEVQKRLFDGLSSSLNQMSEYSENSKKNLKATLEWLQNTKHFFSKVSACALTAVKPDLMLHPLLDRSITSSFGKLEAAIEPIYEIISNTLINRIDDALTKYTKGLNQVHSSFRSLASDLLNAYEEFISCVPQTVRITSSAEELNEGFRTHCNYLRYFNAIDELEQEFLNVLAKMRTLHTELSNFESEQWKSMNTVCLQRFPMLEGIGIEQPNPDVGPDFDAFEEDMKIKIANFRIPNLLTPPVMQFENVTLKMVATSNFTATMVHEISLEAQKVVEVIDPTLSDVWKVRMPNGTEGYVPCHILVPVPNPK